MGIQATGFKHKNLNMRFVYLCLLTFLLFKYDCPAQSSQDSITVAGSTEFRISRSRSFWMGTNYRKEWVTPIRVPVINMKAEGLEPVKRGGGKQTRSLRLQDAEGKEYNFRSIKKFITSKTLPADLESEAAKDIVSDGISASYPYSALSMPVLAEAAGVPYLKSRVVYIPDDPALGEHRKDFGNLLAYLEEKIPDSVKKDYDTEEVVKKLKQDNVNTVDQKAVLKARILDMFVMDFDRHEDQWEWGAIDRGKGKQYYPIPKDRDQAFYINEGVLPHIVQWPWLVPQLEGLKAKTRNIKRFNFAARNFDRFFLNELSEQDWIDAAAAFLSQMTDTVIEKAMAEQPPEIRNISGPEIVNTLKERRKHLAGDLMEYYRFLAEVVDITASNKDELLDVTRHEDGSVDLLVSDLTTNDTVYKRKFDARDTKEIRIYGFGGNDRFVVNGNNDKIKIRMIGGKGDDSFENNASSEGAIVYDDKDGNNSFNGKFKQKLHHDTIANHYDPIYYKYNQVIPFISVGYNPDDGVYLGGWMKIIHHGFRKTPYKNSHSITLNHALATRAFNFRYNAEFIGVIGTKTDLLVEADIKSPHVPNFFGYGASTVYDKSKPGKFRYYRTRYNLGDISIGLRRNFSQKVSMSLGPTFQFFKMDSAESYNRKRFITREIPPGLDPARAFSKQSYVGGRFSLTADTRDHRSLPNKGIFWHSSVRYLSGLNDASYDVTQVNSDFSFYVPFIKKVLILANRTGGGHNFGDFEIHQAQYLGNDDHLRGYRKYRFAGHSKFYNNTELRWLIANFKTYLFPGSLGLLAFYDTGRIWADNDDSNKWLSGYGGGIWISPFNRAVLTITYAASKEDKMPLVSLGWRF